MGPGAPAMPAIPSEPGLPLTKQTNGYNFSLMLDKKRKQFLHKHKDHSAALKISSKRKRPQRKLS